MSKSFGFHELMAKALICFKNAEAHILYSWSHRDEALASYYEGNAYLLVDIYAYNCVIHKWPHEWLTDAMRQQIERLDLLRERVLGLILKSYEDETEFYENQERSIDDQND